MPCLRGDLIYKAATSAMRGERCDTSRLSADEHGKKDERMPCLRRFDLKRGGLGDALRALRYFMNYCSKNPLNANISLQLADAMHDNTVP